MVLSLLDVTQHTTEQCRCVTTLLGFVLHPGLQQKRVTRDPVCQQNQKPPSPLPALAIAPQSSHGSYSNRAQAMHTLQQEHAP